MYYWDVNRRQRIKTVLKIIVEKFFSSMSIDILTKSDHSINGLQPFVREFFLRQSHGVLHLGAHEGQEARTYALLAKPVIWIEAIPVHFKRLQEHIEQFKNQTALNALLDSRCHSSREFFITSNNGESSSIFPLAGNQYWLGLENTEVSELPSMRLDCIVSEQQLQGFDYWIVDVQGAEIEVLVGAGNLLSLCKYLQVEISQEEFYQGGAQFVDLRDFLKSKSFFPLWLPTHSHEEIIFVNTNLMAVH